MEPGRGSGHCGTLIVSTRVTMDRVVQSFSCTRASFGNIFRATLPPTNMEVNNPQIVEKHCFPGAYIFHFYDCFTECHSRTYSIGETRSQRTSKASQSRLRCIPRHSMYAAVCGLPPQPDPSWPTPGRFSAVLWQSQTCRVWD